MPQDQSLIRRFLGTVHAASSADIELMSEIGLGFNRLDCTWAAIQPNGGENIDFDRPQHYGTIPDAFGRLHAANIETLAILSYGTPWAAPNVWEFEDQDIHFRAQKVDPASPWKLNGIDSKTGEKIVDTNCPSGDFSVPPAKTEHWINYVETVVRKLSAPPFNCQFFQVWNEPTIDGFLAASSEQYVDRLLIPAAKVTRHCNDNVCQ